MFWTGRVEIEADTYGFCGWRTDDLLAHADGEYIKDWTEVGGGPGKAKLFIFENTYLGAIQITRDTFLTPCMICDLFYFQK